MLDFLIISSRFSKGKMEIYPKFKVMKSNDLMIRGGDFYAIWDAESKLWSTDEDDAVRLIDNELDKYYLEHKNEMVTVSHMWDSDTGVIDKWHKYCQKQMRDCYHNLDEKIIFENNEIKKTDYASHIIPYRMEPGDISAYEKMTSVLYSDEERHKFEWAIGSIIAGDSKKIQKFVVFYGAGGTGKSTILNIIEDMFPGYSCQFVSADLASKTASFALEAFSSNPLIGIEQDGNLSRIETNTRLNSLISHEKMLVNEKFKKQYPQRFNAMLFIGSNEPVKITNAKSGIIRRLIDISPTGNLIPKREYNKLNKEIRFELGAIAQHCYDVYMDDPNAYDNYISDNMILATNDFFNFISDNILIFERQEEISDDQAWKIYKAWAEDSAMEFSMNKRVFKQELKNYFREFDGKMYKGFNISKFEKKPGGKIEENKSDDWLDLHEGPSLLDDILKDQPAQLANDAGIPTKPWAKVLTKLIDISTSSLHYVKMPLHHIVIDFDLKNKAGKKDFRLNRKAAEAWPRTYAELSQGGQGIHLHYLYSGDPTKLAAMFGDDIEIKVFKGNASLRRRLTKHNDIPIATLSSGLPLKEEKGKKIMVDPESIKSVQSLRKMIQRNLNKEIHEDTTSSVNFIKKILDDAYASGMEYDVTDMRNTILAFAASSTHQAGNCLKQVTKMKFKSESDIENSVAAANDNLVFFDCEVFPNLLLINWKVQGEGKPMVRMINPTPDAVEALFKMNLVGFNCRKYDNHILYAASLGWNNNDIYQLSQRIVTGDRNAFFGEAYNISYTDVYDFCSKKQSLKKWEVELGIHHQELGLPWDQPVPEEMWKKVAEYCDNDVIATEKVFEARKADFVAREILADISGGSVNDTTNTLTAKLIFGKDRHPQAQFNYRDLGKKPEGKSFTHEDAAAWARGELPWRPEGLVWFPGYSYANGKSTYRDEDGSLDEDGNEKIVGEGGYVYAVPGFYGNIRTQDVASMHPHSALAEELFGPKYTKNFADLVQARIYIKHKDFEAAGELFDGKLKKYLDDPDMAKALSGALKIAINSVYGLTAAKFPNQFRDERNIDNIVAKRGALFMIDLKHFVLEEGFMVAHIKTDSIKVPDITDEMIEKIKRFGDCYGYSFETEADFEKLCLVNDAVYIAKERTDDGYLWEATGAQFKVPYVFKKLFSKEEINFEDLCETKEVKNSAIYLDYGEGDEHDIRFVGRIGSFCPILPGKGGAQLVRSKVDKDGNVKYDAVTGTKDFRWLEAEVVRKAGREDDIDISYYESLCEDAMDTIHEYIDFEWFVSDDPADIYKPPAYENGRPVYKSEVPIEDAVPYTNIIPM